MPPQPLSYRIPKDVGNVMPNSERGSRASARRGRGLLSNFDLEEQKDAPNQSDQRPQDRTARDTLLENKKANRNQEDRGE